MSALFCIQIAGCLRGSRIVFGKSSHEFNPMIAFKNMSMRTCQRDNRVMDIALARIIQRSYCQLRKGGCEYEKGCSDGLYASAVQLR
jgi:hypothetical protein